MTNDSNLFDFDYRSAAESFARLPFPIIDVHTHINGTRAALLLREVMDLYGVGLVFSMSRAHEMAPVKEVLGDRIRFIATPDYWAANLRRAVTDDYVKNLTRWAADGVRIAKFWSPPRAVDLGLAAGDGNLLRIDSPQMLAVMQHAVDLGLIIMVHVSDPDTWFASKYTNRALYGTKREQYAALETVLDRFRSPFIAAHMGGSPEDLAFLDALLERHPHLYLDSSATKWIVRELSKHPRPAVLEFFTKWRGRILFGSDIVTSDDHFHMSAPTGTSNDKASSEREAFDLYASRYFALRTLFETTFDGRSPIADPDLALSVHPGSLSPRLVGQGFPAEILRVFYHDAVRGLLPNECPDGVR